MGGRRLSGRQRPAKVEVISTPPWPLVPLGTTATTDPATDGPTWDMAEADVTGLQEVNGIRVFEDTKLHRTITP
jgi:hypothetical protein